MRTYVFLGGRVLGVAMVALFGAVGPAGTAAADRARGDADHFRA